jgi:hypothetical protein
VILKDQPDRPGAFLRGRDERRWLLGLGIVTACSWGRWLATGSPKVDENYPSELAGGLLFVGLVVGWALLVVGWRGLLAHPPMQPRRLAFLGLGVAGVMLPMLSNDLFSVLSYASLAAQGRDVYTTVSWLPHSVWSPWVGERWAEKVCVYGPTTLVAALPGALGGANPWLAMAALRLAWFIPLALVMELSFRRFRDRPAFHAMVWLNPLWLVEGPGQLHTDLLGVVAVTAGILLQTGGRPRAGWVLYGLAVLGKYTFVFDGLWFWLCGATTLRQRLLRLPVLAATVLGLAVLAFAPFWRGPATLTEPIRALAGMNPGGSITEVAGILVDLLRGGGVPHAGSPVTSTLELDRATHATTWWAVSLVLRVVTLGLAARLLTLVLRRPADRNRLALGTGALAVAVITLASHRFQSWYLLAALPFFGLHCTAAWRRWWLAVVALAVSTEFVHVLPRASALLPVWSVVTNGGVVVAFLAFFRARYWTLEDPSAAGGAR